MIKDQMEKIYREMSPDDIPWNIETPPEILQALITKNVLRPCKVIELGCGAGNYVIYFAKNGFDAIGVDISENAIHMARKSALRAGIQCTFVVADVLGDISEIHDEFDFAYDWELLHHIFPDDRVRYMENVCRLLKPGGHYLSVSFSEKSKQFGGIGKYRKTPLGTVLYFSGEPELERLLKKRFVVEDLKTVDIKGKHAIHTAVYALCRKKNG
ncbi:MAG: class I SAM-dependent methyltransferase [Candidatus Deferrimicrobiaceae bacterium]